MQKKIIITGAALVLIVGAGAFYGGMQYGVRKTKADSSRGAGFVGAGGRGGQGMGQRGSQANGGAGDFASGQIISKDDGSVTIKNRAGGSQTVYFSSATLIGKSVSGATADLGVGAQITASGKNNPDGSLAAQDIQIRPSQADQAPQQNR